MEQVREKRRASRPSEVPVELSYTRPPMDDKEKEALQEAAAGVPTYYATSVRVRTNVHDISLLFSRSVPVGTERAEAESTVCVVSMSPALMMSMFRLIERHTSIYQKKHAPLPDFLKFADEDSPAPEPPDAS